MIAPPIFTDITGWGWAQVLFEKMYKTSLDWAQWKRSKRMQWPDSPAIIQSLCVKTAFPLFAVSSFGTSSLLLVVPLVLSCLSPWCEPYFARWPYPFKKHISLWWNIFSLHTWTGFCSFDLNFSNLFKDVKFTFRGGEKNYQGDVRMPNSNFKWSNYVKLFCVALSWDHVFVILVGFVVGLVYVVCKENISCSRKKDGYWRS